VQETLPWSFSGAYDAINVAILLVAGGFLVLGYRLIQKPERELILVVVWSLVMLLLTIQFQRFLYYFTVNSALLCALCITEPFRWDLNMILRRIPPVILEQPDNGDGKPYSEKQPVPEKPAKKKKAIPAARKTADWADILKLACIAAICILTVAHIGISLSQDIHYAVDAKDRVIPEDWLETLGWLRSGTPDPGIGYFDTYGIAGYTVPADSYGILAVWDAGHWITFFSHRMPVANPFQDNLGGKSGTAAFFLSENETQANGILQKFRGMYVITDSTMAVDRFTNLVPWISGSADISSYIRWFLVPDTKDPAHLQKIHLFDDAYFRTMVVRLHNFDGSQTDPTQAEYVKYTIRKPTAQERAEASGFSRVITGRQTINLTGSNMTSTPVIAEGPERCPHPMQTFIQKSRTSRSGQSPPSPITGWCTSHRRTHPLRRSRNPNHFP